MNIELLRIRRRQLFGQSRDTRVNLDGDAINTAIKLAIQGKPVSEESVLLEQMRLRLEVMPNNEWKPFARAIAVIYQKTTNQQK